MYFEGEALETFVAPSLFGPLLQLSEAALVEICNIEKVD